MKKSFSGLRDSGERGAYAAHTGTGKTGYDKAEGAFMKRYTIGAALVLCLALGTGAMAAQTNPGIAPIQSRPHGQTYSEWAALWWQWALEIPASVNPLTDLLGVHCAQGQSNHVWFLAGRASFLSGEGPVTRTCTVPTGTALGSMTITHLLLAGSPALGRRTRTRCP